MEGKIQKVEITLFVGAARCLCESNHFVKKLVPIYKAYKSKWNRYCSKYYKDCIESESLGKISIRRCLQTMIVAEYVNNAKSELTALIVETYAKIVAEPTQISLDDIKNFDDYTLTTGKHYLIRIYLSRILDNGTYNLDFSIIMDKLYQASSIENFLKDRLQGVKVPSIRAKSENLKKIKTFLELVCDKEGLVLEEPKLHRKDYEVLEQITKYVAEDDDVLLAYLHASSGYCNLLVKNVVHFRELYLEIALKSDADKSFLSRTKTTEKELREELKEKNEYIESLKFNIDTLTRQVEYWKNQATQSQPSREVELLKEEKKYSSILRKRLDFLTKEFNITESFIDEYLSSYQD